jgi:hypothetical protein
MNRTLLNFTCGSLFFGHDVLNVRHASFTCQKFH